MKKIMNFLVRKSSFTFYKRTLALVLAFVMLFNLSGEAFANLTKVSARNEEEIKRLEEELSQLREVEESKSSARSNKSLRDKMLEAKERYIIALVKYNYAVQLTRGYENINKAYDKVAGELEKEYESIESDEGILLEEKEQLDLKEMAKEDPEIEKYITKTPGYRSWQSNRKRKLKEKEEKKEAISALEKEIGGEKAGLEKLKGRKAKKASERIAEKEAQLGILKRNLAAIEPEIKENDAKWAWYEAIDKEMTRKREEYNAKVEGYNERIDIYNERVENYDKDIKISGAKYAYNKVLEDLYGVEAVPEEMKAHLEYDREALIDRYNNITWNKIKEVEREYNIAATRYENASKAYYDDLLVRYGYYEQYKNKKQCDLTKKVLEKRQEGSENIDEWGWRAIKWLSQDQLKNSTPSGIKEALTATWNTCGTGIAIQNADDLDSMSWDGYKENINSNEYVDIKFYEYYEEYVKESEKHYEAVVRENPKDITKVTILPAYYFAPDSQWEQLEGKRRGREIFMLMLANHELGYAMYRASVVKGGMGNVYSEYIEKQENQEEAEELEESEYVNLRGYNKVPRLEYNRYLVYDKPTDATKKRIFLRAKRMEEYSRNEVHRLMGKVVKGMYLDGKSMGEILGSEGITKSDIDAVFNKYAELMDKQTLANQKANLANDLEFRDYSGLIKWEVRDKFKPTKFEKVMNALFIWLPSNWAPVVKDEISGERMSMEAKHTLDRARAEASRLERYAQIHKNHHFKEFVYVLSETSYNWKRHLLPIVSRINEEKQDIETATMLAELATGLKDNLKIKELALVAQRNTNYQLQEDPFYIVKTFVFDTITLIGIGKVIQVLSRLVQAAKIARISTPLAKTGQITSKVKEPKKMPVAKVGRPSKMRLESPSKTSLTKIKSKIKTDKKIASEQSRTGKARNAEERGRQKALEQEAAEHVAYQKALAEGKIAAHQPMTVSQRIKRAWTNFRVGTSIWWNVFKTPKYALSLVSATGGEVAPATVVIEQVSTGEKAAQELTYVVGEVAKEGQVAGEAASKVASIAREARAAVEAGQAASKTQASQRSILEYLLEYLNAYRATHIHRGLEVVSAIPSFKFGYQGASVLNSMASSRVGSIPTVEAPKVEDLANIAQKAYPEMTKEQINEYIKAGEVMFANGEKPVIGVTHPITTVSYQKAEEDAITQKVALELQQETLGQFNNTQHFSAAAMFVAPVPLDWLMNLGKPKMSKAKEEALQIIIQDSVKAETEALGTQQIDEASFKERVAVRVNERVQNSNTFNLRQKRLIKNSLSNLIVNAVNETNTSPKGWHKIFGNSNRAKNNLNLSQQELQNFVNALTSFLAKDEVSEEDFLNFLREQGIKPVTENKVAHGTAGNDYEKTYKDFVAAFMNLDFTKDPEQLAKKFVFDTGLDKFKYGGQILIKKGSATKEGEIKKDFERTNTFYVSSKNFKLNENESLVMDSYGNIYKLRIVKKGEKVKEVKKYYQNVVATQVTIPGLDMPIVVIGETFNKLAVLNFLFMLMGFSSLGRFVNGPIKDLWPNLPEAVAMALGTGIYLTNILAIPFGPLIDKLGAKKMVAFAIGEIILASLLPTLFGMSGFSDINPTDTRLAVLAFTSVLYGSAAAGLQQIVNTTASNMLGGKEAGYVTAGGQMFKSIGSLSTYIFYAVAVGLLRAKWPAMYWLMGIPGIIGAILLGISDLPLQSKATKQESGQRKLDFILSWGGLPILAAIMLLCGSETLVSVTTKGLMKNWLGEMAFLNNDAIQMAVTGIITMGPALVGRSLAKRLMKKFSDVPNYNQKMLLIAAVVATASAAAIKELGSSAGLVGLLFVMTSNMTLANFFTFGANIMKNYNNEKFGGKFDSLVGTLTTMGIVGCFLVPTLTSLIMPAGSTPFDNLIVPMILIPAAIIIMIPHLKGANPFKWSAPMKSKDMETLSKEYAASIQEAVENMTEEDAQKAMQEIRLGLATELGIAVTDVDTFLQTGELPTLNEETINKLAGFWGISSSDMKKVLSGKNDKAILDKINKNMSKKLQELMDTYDVDITPGDLEELWEH